MHILDITQELRKCGDLPPKNQGPTAAIVLTFISAYLAEFPEWRMIVYSVTMIVLMLRRPQGLFGSAELSAQMFKGLTKRIGGVKIGK